MRRKKKILIFTALMFLVMLFVVPVSDDYDPVVIPRDIRMLAAAPTNSETPECTNLDDTTFMYSKLREYLITVNVSDIDGYIDIATIDFSLLDPADNATIWTIRYTNSTDTFSETAGQTLIELVTGNSAAVRSGNNINLTIAVKIEWGHGDYVDTNCRSTVDDGVTATMDNYTATNWDVETDLDFSGLAISDSEGPYGQTNTISGTVIYQGSALYPASGDVDVWCAVPTGLTAQSDLTLSSGAFSMSAVPSKTSTGINTYTITAVAESGGASGTDLCHATHTLTFTGTGRGNLITDDGGDTPIDDIVGFGAFLLLVIVCGAICVGVIYVVFKVI